MLLALLVLLCLEFYFKPIILKYSSDFIRTLFGPVRCYCPNSINNLNGSPFQRTDIQIPCPGNTNQKCGGYDYFPSNIYESIKKFCLSFSYKFIISILS